MGRRVITIGASGLVLALQVLTLSSCPDMNLRKIVEDKITGVYYVNLSDLEISQGTLSPSFRADATSYSAWIQSAVASITVTPTAMDNGASIAVNGIITQSGTNSSTIALSPGQNTVQIQVTSEDRTATKTYMIALYKALGLPKTGQSIIYSAGDDGDLEKGFAWPIPRFVDNGDGTITDNLTALLWVRNGNLMITRDPAFDTDETSNDGAVTWQHALDYIALLNSANFANHSDWRLPNRRELRSLAHYGQDSVSWLNEQGFIAVEWDNCYWTSSTYVPLPSDAMIADMPYGDTMIWPKSLTGYVLPVRAGESGGQVMLPKTGQSLCYNSSGNVLSCINTGQDGALQRGIAWPTPRFVDNGDGTITDRLSGLMWDQNGNRAGAPRTWDQALSDCNILSLGGYNDWRLPNFNELESLINSGEADSATWLNAQGFSGVVGGSGNLYWSSTTFLAHTSTAWHVQMSYGFAMNDVKTGSHYVLAVRDGQ
jgi:hypothetical protein